MKLKNRLGIFIALFAFALYAQSVSFNYAIDDSLVITENNLIKEGLSAIPTLLKTDYLYGFEDQTARGPEYRPLPMAMFALEWQFFPNNPHVYHLVNVLLYSLTCWLLFILLCNLMEVWKAERLKETKGKSFRYSDISIFQSMLFPFVCTLLFAAHPIHTEVVDNIKSLDEILCFLFSILSVLLFFKGEEKQSVFKIALGIIFFSLSLFSKETGISYLFIIPLILFVFSKTKPKKIIIITFSLVFVTGIFFLIRAQVFESLPKYIVPGSITPYSNSLTNVPDIISRNATAFFILLKYIFLLVFPYRMSYDYSIAQIPVHQISSPDALLGIIVYLTIGIYATLKLREKNILAFAIFFYLLTLAPVSNIFLLISSTMAERFLFMPSLGFCMVLTFFILKIQDLGFKKKQLPFKFKSHYLNFQLIPLLIIFIILSLYCIRTIARNPDWKDNATLVSHDLKIVPNSSRAHYTYGLALLFTFYPMEKGKEARNDLLNKAIKEFTKSISIYSDFPKAYSCLGAAYLDLRDYKNAAINYEIALGTFYQKAPAYVYCDLGFVYSETGQYAKALCILDSSLKYYPDYADAYVKKSYVYLKEGKNMEAIVECDKLLGLDSNNIFAYVNKGYGYFNLKQYPKAIEYLNKALEMDPKNSDCLRFLAMSYLNMGDTIRADKYLKRIQP